MIEINLVPGSAKRQKQRMPAFSNPLKNLRFGGSGGGGSSSLNRASVLTGAAWLIGLGLTAFLHFGSTSQKHQLEVDVQAAQRDSARLHNLRVLNDSLRGQIDEIGAKLTVLQELDAGRYVWSHLLDELSRALPQHTWLVSVADDNSETAAARVRIEGRTGNTFALARYMQDLEVSAFIRNVMIVSQTTTKIGEKQVYAFILEMDYEDPVPDAIETRPLFTETGEVMLGGVRPDAFQLAKEGN